MTIVDAMLDNDFGRRALLAAGVIGFVNGYLGGYVVMRRAALFAGGLTHALFPGIAVGALIAGLNPVSALLGASIAALAVGLGATGIARASRLDRDAALAILFSAAFGGGLIVLQRLPVFVNIEDYLFGNILAVSDFDLWFVYGAGFVVLSILLLLQRPLLLYLFSEEVAASQGVPVARMGYLLAALLVLDMIASLQAVGAMLTLGLLVAPAAILYLYSDNPRFILWGGGALGALAALGGVALSYGLNVQTGAAMAALMGALFLLGFAFSPRYGLASGWFRRYRLRAETRA